MNSTRGAYGALLCTALLGCAEPAEATTPLPPPQFRAPAEVLTAAETYAKALPWGQDRGAARDTWLMGFFDGFTAPVAPPRDSDDRRRHQQAGLHAGYAFRQAKAADLDQLMAGFGYQRVTAEGQLIIGFEASFLRPSQDPTEKWWVHCMTADASDSITAATQRTKSFAAGARDKVALDAKVRIVGYLSAAGSYGHLATCRHELRAISVEVLGS